MGNIIIIGNALERSPTLCLFHSSSSVTPVVAQYSVVVSSSHPHTECFQDNAFQQWWLVIVLYVRFYYHHIVEICDRDGRKRKKRERVD